MTDRFTRNRSLTLILCIGGAFWLIAGGIIYALIK